MCCKKISNSFYFLQANNEGIQGNFSGDLLQSGGVLIVAKGINISLLIKPSINQKKENILIGVYA